MGIREFSRSGDAAGAFRKTATSDRIRAEANGLKAIAATGTLRTPALLAVGDTELLTERIEPGAASTSSWQTLGGQLAAMHCISQPCFGFVEDNFCGDTPQPNPRTADGHEFFAEYRLAYQGRMAYDAGLLEQRDMQALEQLCRRLPTLVPAQGPSLLHGDLWNGNVLFDPAGEPVVIDPACYWGWPEAEIAMCALFGGFQQAFYLGWEETATPAAGWRDRLPIYQLYHQLNHLNLFGRSYYTGVIRVLQRFS